MYRTMRIPPVVLLLLFIISCDKSDDPTPPPPEPPDESPGYISFEEWAPPSLNLAIASINPDGSGQKQLTPVSGAQDFDCSMPTISFDRKKIVFCSNLDGELNDEGIYIMDSTGINIQKVIDDPQMRESGGSLSPDGKTILYSGYDPTNLGQIYTCNVDGTNRKSLTSFNDPTPPKLYYNPNWSKDGTKITFLSNRDAKHSQIYTMNRDGSNVQMVGPADTVTRHGAKLSPDGKKFVYYRHRDNSFTARVMEIWTVNSDGANNKQLTSLGVISGDPVWSPDSKYILFVSDKDRPGSLTGSTELYIIKADGTELKRITNSDTRKLFPSWR